MKFPEYKSLSVEEKKKLLTDLRAQWKNAATDVDRKIIEIRANYIKRTIHELV